MSTEETAAVRYCHRTVSHLHFTGPSSAKAVTKASIYKNHTGEGNGPLGVGRSYPGFNAQDCMQAFTVACFARSQSQESRVRCNAPSVLHRKLLQRPLHCMPMDPDLKSRACRLGACLALTGHGLSTVWCAGAEMTGCSQPACHAACIASFVVCTCRR